MNALTQFFNATTAVVKSKVALPFVKYILNQLFSPYLYPLQSISESNSVVTLNCLRVKVNEINEMFLNKHGIVELKEASLSHITLDPINTLIHHSSCEDPCHITFHNIYAHVALKEVPPAHLAAAANSKEKIHEIASEIIGDLLAEWMLEREKTKRIVKEMKDQVASPHLSPGTTSSHGATSNHHQNSSRSSASHQYQQSQADDVKKSSQQMIDDVLDKLQVHLLGMKIDIELSPTEVIRVEIPEVHYKDQSYMKSPDMRIEVYQIVTPQMLISQLDICNGPVDVNANEPQSTVEMELHNSETDSLLSSMDDMRRSLPHADDSSSTTATATADTPKTTSSIPTNNAKSYFDSLNKQLLLGMQQLLLTITLPGDHSILIRAHQQQIFALLMPQQISSIGSLLEHFLNIPTRSTAPTPTDAPHNVSIDLESHSFFEHSVLPDEIRQLNQNQMASKGNTMDDSRFSLSNSNMDDSLLFQSFYDENPEVRVSTRITVDYLSLFYLYENHCITADDLLRGRVFEVSPHISGLNLTLKKVQVEIPQRRDFALSIPFLRLEEFFQGKNLVVLSKNAMTTPGAAAPTSTSSPDIPFFHLLLSTERISHERDIVHQTISLGALKAFLDLALIDRIRCSLPENFLSVLSGSSDTAPPTSNPHQNQIFVHTTDTHVKINLQSLHLDIEHNDVKSQFGDNSLTILLEMFTVDKQTFNQNLSSSMVNFNTAYTSIDARRICLSLLCERDCSYPLLNLTDLIVKVENRRSGITPPLFELHTTNTGSNHPDSSSDRISQALFELGARDRHEHYFNFAPVAVSVSLAHTAVVMTKHEFLRIQELIQAMTTVFSNAEDTIPTSPPRLDSATFDVHSLVYKVLPNVSATVTLKHVAVQLRELAAGGTSHHYAISADHTLVLFDAYDATTEGNSKSNIFAECLGHITVDGLFIDAPSRPLIRSHSGLVKDFRVYKQPVVANIELEKNISVDRMGVRGLISVNGMQLFLTATPPEDIFIMGIMEFLSNPDVPPPAVSDICVEVAVNNSLVDYQSPICNARLVLCVDSVLVEAQVQDPPTAQNINVLLQLSDETEVLIHKDYRLGSLLPVTSLPRHFSLTSHLQSLGFVSVVNLDQFSMRAILLGDKITPSRQSAPVQVHINDGRITVGLCRDSLALLQKLGTDYQTHVGNLSAERARAIQATNGDASSPSLTSKVTQPKTSQVLSPFTSMQVDESYFQPSQQRKRVGSMGVKVTSHHPLSLNTIVHDYFTIPKRYRSHKSNSRAPLPNFLPVASVELSLTLDILFTLYEGDDWTENPHVSSLSSNARDTKSNLSVQLTELFAQIDLFPPPVGQPHNMSCAVTTPLTTHHVMSCRASLQDLHVQHQDVGLNTIADIIKRQPWNYTQRAPPRLCDLQLHLRRDHNSTLHVDLDVFHIFPLRVFLSMGLYQFVVGLLSGRSQEEIVPARSDFETDLLLSGESIQTTNSPSQFDDATPQTADIIFDSFKIAPLRCIANVPFITVRNAKLSLFGVSYSNVRGTEQLLKVLTTDTSQELRRHSLFNLFTSLFFVRNIKGVTDGTYDLIAMPYTHCVRDGRVLYGIQLGITSFLSSFVSETVGCTSDVTYALGEGMQYVKDVLHKDTDDANDSTQNFSEPPQSGIEAYNQAKVMLLKSVKGAYQPIIAIPTKYRQQGTGAVAKSLVKALPVMVLSPSAGMVRALSTVLYGVQSSLSQTRSEEEYF